MPNREIISARGLCKAFYSGTTFLDLLRGRLRGRRIDALRGLSLSVREGEILGVVGPNGAGKTTLLRLFAGLLTPDAGGLQILGEAGNARPPAAFRAQVSYVISDDRSFSWRLTGQQNLRFFAALYGLSGQQALRRVSHALETVDLQDEADRPVREYSTGMRSRLAFARALLGDPRIWLFDELTRGMDPAAASRLRDFVRRELICDGATAIIATHDLVEIEQLCSRIVVLDRGEISGEGAPGAARALLELPEQRR